jgi:hypothetical protein
LSDSPTGSTNIRSDPSENDLRETLLKICDTRGPSPMMCRQYSSTLRSSSSTSHIFASSISTTYEEKSPFWKVIWGDRAQVEAAIEMKGYQVCYTTRACAIIVTVTPLSRGFINIHYLAKVSWLLMRKMALLVEGREWPSQLKPFLSHSPFISIVDLLVPPSYFCGLAIIH